MVDGGAGAVVDGGAGAVVYGGVGAVVDGGAGTVVDGGAAIQDTVADAPRPSKKLRTTNVPGC